MTNKRYTISAAPHLRSGRTIPKTILGFIIALIPATGFGIYQFGLPAALLIAISILTAVGTELSIDLVARRPIKINDGHSVLVGLMFALMLPAGCPWWVAVVGAGSGVLFGKLPFGSLGGSPLSPAIIGLLVITVSWPSHTTAYIQPISADEALHSDNTILAESPMQAVTIDPSDEYDYDIINLFTGHKKIGGIGTTSPLLLLIGGIFLLVTGRIRIQAPVGFIIGVCLLAGLFYLSNPSNPAILFHLFVGFTLFAAFFLCTEIPVTPVTPIGMFLFGLVAGLLTVLLRNSGMDFGSAAYGVIIACLATPLFDRIQPKPFGRKAVSNAQ